MSSILDTFVGTAVLGVPTSTPLLSEEPGREALSFSASSLIKKERDLSVSETTMTSMTLSPFLSCWTLPVCRNGIVCSFRVESTRGQGPA